MRAVSGDNTRRTKNLTHPIDVRARGIFSWLGIRPGEGAAQDRGWRHIVEKSVEPLRRRRRASQSTEGPRRAPSGTPWRSAQGPPRCAIKTPPRSIDAGGATRASNTDGQPVGSTIMQDDGNVVIYRANGTPAWATNTSV